MPRRTSHPPSFLVAGAPASVAASAYFILVVACFTLQSFATIALAWLVTGLILLRQLPTLAQARGLDRALLVIVALVLTLSLPVAAVRNPTALAHYAVALAMLGAAFLFTRDMDVYYRASRAVLLCLQAVVGVYLLFAGLRDFPLENMIPGSSSNGITSYLVLLQVNYCVALFLRHRRVAWVTPVLTLAICVVGFGRGSLIASAAILVLGALYRLLVVRRLRIGLMVVCMLLLLVFTLLGGWGNLRTLVEAHTKLGGGIFDQARASIILEYLSRLDAFGLLFGAGFEGTVIDTQFHDNPHNSLIRAHHIFGLAYLLLFLGLPWTVLGAGRCWRDRLFLFALFSVLVFRAFTETIVFPTLLDLFFFGICLACRRAAGMANGPAVALPRALIHAPQ